MLCRSGVQHVGMYTALFFPDYHKRMSRFNTESLGHQGSVNFISFIRSAVETFSNSSRSTSCNSGQVYLKLIHRRRPVTRECHKFEILANKTRYLLQLRLPYTNTKVTQLRFCSSCWDNIVSSSPLDSSEAAE